MSFIDIAYLRKQDLQNGYVTYCRRKTGQRLSIHWEKHMADIVKKYDKLTDHYMFPIIRKEQKDERAQYRQTMKEVNKRLKQIAASIGITVPLTLYVARHSWASIAHEVHIPISIISESMGHDSEATTQIYLMALDSAAIDWANRKILSNI